MNRILTRAALAASFTLITVPVPADEDVGPECRGVAAGVVAAMRASGELTSDEATTAAVVAARRACAAARQGLGESSAGATAPAAAAADKADEDESSVWDFLTRDTERKPGNERLRRLKTQ